jgi:hypothetical protein
MTLSQQLPDYVRPPVPASGCRPANRTRPNAKSSSSPASTSGRSRCGTSPRGCACRWRLPLLLADLPSLKAKYVGESEGRVRRFIGLCEAMAPVCVLLDEVEDALAGADRAYGSRSCTSTTAIPLVIDP